MTFISYTLQPQNEQQMTLAALQVQVDLMQVVHEHLGIRSLTDGNEFNILLGTTNPSSFINPKSSGSNSS